MYHSDESVKRLKAMFVVYRFSQIHNTDYTETFAFIIRRESLRIFLVIATMLGIIILQIDVIGAYLESFHSQNN